MKHTSSLKSRTFLSGLCYTDVRDAWYVTFKQHYPVKFGTLFIPPQPTMKPLQPATSHTVTSATVPHTLSRAGNKTITSTGSTSSSMLSSNSTTKAIDAGAPGVTGITASTTRSISSTSSSSSRKALDSSTIKTSRATSTVPSISSGKDKATGPNPIGASSTSTTTSTATFPVTTSDNKAPDANTSSKMTSAITSMRTSDSDSPIGNASKVTSVITDSRQRTTSTSTITDQPDSTFSSAVPITVTDPKGKSSVTFPPLVTVFSTTSESNGSVVTFTRVIANPTGLVGGIQETRTSSFLNNGGEVAGVFVVVGIVVASIVLFVCLTFQRRRNQARHRKRWLANIQRPLPLPPNPFEDPPEPRSMMQVENLRENHHGDVASNAGHTYPESGPSIGLALTGLEPVETDQPANDEYANKIQHAFSTIHQPRHLFAQSSPSLYPPSLPPDDARLDKDVDVQLASNFKRSLDEHKVVPPRPPRSPFREGSAKFIYPITPPPSTISSHDSDLPPTPESCKPSPSAFSAVSNVRTRSSQDDILARPTLLDVRHRASTSP